MLFHTWAFLLFFLAVYPIYLRLRSTRFCLSWLLLTSYVFYGWWNPLYLLLIVYSTALDFLVVRAMDRSERKKMWLSVSLVNNLLLLGLFKYANFLVDNLNRLLALCNSEFEFIEPNLLLPVGISFYTFQSMSYTIDFYRGQIPREKSFIRFAAFVSLFPQLVAGPIERASQLLPQLTSFSRIRSQDIADGLSLFVVGLFKKLALANYLAPLVDPVFAAPSQYDASKLLLATFAFAWQIYFDFSGYTDMARGIARMMGFRLMLNFNNPYLAISLSDFWSRWHISLSTWFRDYVYIPLGGNRRGRRRMFTYLIITFVVSGLWHGAAWTFIIWGALHALGILLTRNLENSAWYGELPKPFRQMLVFLFVCFSWIFFRAGSLSDALLIIRTICDFQFSDPQFPVLALLLVASVWVYQFVCESRLRRVLRYSAVRIGLVVAMLLYIFTCTGGGDQPFIYFQF